MREVNIRTMMVLEDSERISSCAHDKGFFFSRLILSDFVFLFILGIQCTAKVGIARIGNRGAWEKCSAIRIGYSIVHGVMYELFCMIRNI